jgi:hypothetical protein
MDKISFKKVFESPELAIGYFLQPEIYENGALVINDLIGINNAIELFSGKSAESNFTEDKSRVNAAIELSMFSFGSEVKAEGWLLKIEGDPTKNVSGQLTTKVEGKI